MLILILIVSCYSVQAQRHKQLKKDGFFSFFRMKNGLTSFRWLRSSPRLTTVLSDHSTPAFNYWQGASFTSYSENGRIVSTNSFDVQGQLRETRTSFILRKRGLLSNWRVQISSQRNRPYFIYTIQ
jgi:hypothetical protein